MIRLPPYHCIFSPIEYCWGYLKTKIRDQSTSKTKVTEIGEIGIHILEEMTAEIIQKFYGRARKSEEYFLKEEFGSLVTLNEPIIIRIDDENSGWESEIDEEIDVVGDESYESDADEFFEGDENYDYDAEDFFEI